MNILFPIETIGRELDYKLALAHVLKNKFPELNILLGSVTMIHTLAESFKNGLYIGKNIFSSSNVDNSKARYSQFKSNGFDIVYLHEEGAVFLGEYDSWVEEIRKQYDISIFDKNDVICVWGEVQKKIEEKRNINQIPIKVTGHPRMDLLHTHPDFFEKKAFELKKKYGRFILVNGNFGTYNFGGSFNKIFEYLKDRDKGYEDNLTWFMNWFLSESKRMYRMVELILRAAHEFPQYNFIYRPHPSELLETYHELFEGKSNIIIERVGPVNPYILASEALIHDGCTTALEAYNSNIPILNYKPVSDEFDLYLPNQVGQFITTVDEALSFIKNIINHSDLDYQRNSLEDKAKSLLYNLKSDDSFNMYLSVIEDKIKERKVTKFRSPTISNLRRYSVMRYLKIQSALIKNKIFSNNDKLKRDMYLINKFPGFKKSEIFDKLKILNKKNNANIKLNYLSKEVILFSGIN